ncbi:MAG TPA: aconitase X catalytic domain-containing protein [Anaerolineaceae bacterium]|nr:aconitase X catalytic domain-containing protein [Anaerolineaceae bacterium]
MILTPEQSSLLNGGRGPAARKAMQILAALGKIYGAERMLPVSSVQVSGVSYDNLGDAGLEFLAELADGGGKACVLTTLNPAGMDIEAWQSLGIDSGFAQRQQQVLEAFSRMGILATCTCTPYLVGNLPHFGEHIAWSESSAVCFANSVIGARTNREGGPSALAAALTGFTPAYGYHLDQNRIPNLTVNVASPLNGSDEFGLLGIVIGNALEKRGSKLVPYIVGIPSASLEELKSFCASLATYGGAALFHMQGITPEASFYQPPSDSILVTQQAIEAAAKSVNSASSSPFSTENHSLASPSIDFVTLGCPHLSIREVARIAELLRGQQVKREFWITTARPTKQLADRLGYSAVIESAGARLAADTCCVVAPISRRFSSIATDSAKACYYAFAKNGWSTHLVPFDQAVREALK